VDLFARAMAKLLTRELGQNVIVENRTGADGIIMINQLLRAPADGYLIAANTLTLASLFGEPSACNVAKATTLLTNRPEPSPSST